MYYGGVMFMKKVTVILLLAMLPAMMFSEVVFMPHIGFDLHKGIKSQLLDNVLKDIINKSINKDKKDGETPAYLANDQLPHSNPLIPLFTIGLDMQFIHHGSGFTFFWNHEFSYTPNFKAYEQINYISEKLLSTKGTFNENQKIMLYSFELLMGGTFRREQAFNIHFGIGLKVGFTPSTIGVVVKALQEGRKAIPNQVSMMVVPAFGGTLGFTYYFNNVVGLSVSVNEFLGFGGFLSLRVKERGSDGVPTTAVGYASMGFTNNFAMKIGLNLRVHGIREGGL